MKSGIAAIISWLSIIIIFMVALFIDGLEFSSTNIKQIAIVGAVVGFLALLYFMLIGLPILYVLFKRPYVSRKLFILSGMLASGPMVLLFGIVGELEWLIASILAGVVAGLVFAVVMAAENTI